PTRRGCGLASDLRSRRPWIRTSSCSTRSSRPATRPSGTRARRASWSWPEARRSEEHTSELQSHLNLLCRLLLEKKKKQSGSGHLVREMDSVVVLDAWG